MTSIDISFNLSQKPNINTVINH